MLTFPSLNSTYFGSGFSCAALVPALLDVGHHLGVFAGAAVVDGSGLYIDDLIDDLLVVVPFELGLRGAKTCGNGVHFLQYAVQRNRIGRLLRNCVREEIAIKTGRHREGGNCVLRSHAERAAKNRNRKNERGKFHWRSNRSPNANLLLLPLGQNPVALYLSFEVRNGFVTHNRNRALKSAR